MPQRFFPTDADKKVEALFGAVQRFDGKYTITCGVSGTVISFAVDRDTLVSMRDLIDEELALSAEPEPKKNVRKKPVAYATVQDLESVDASIVRIAVMLGLQPAEIAQAMRTTTSQVRLALELKNTRPKNPPEKD